MMKRILFLLACMTCLSAAPQVERRAAFDIGSGKIKVQVSDVDLMEGKILNVLFTDTARVRLRENLLASIDGRLSKEIQGQAVKAVKELMVKIAPLQPAAYHAIATEPLRLAANGEALAQLIEREAGLPMTIISQEEEGILGFISAVSEAGVDPDRAISWDFGGGSCQITTKCGDHYCVYQGRLGRVPLASALLSIQGKDAYSSATPNPISRSHADQTVQFIKDDLSDVPIEIRQKIRRSNAVVLGIGINPLWGMNQNAHFDKATVLSEVESRLNLDDEAILIKDSISPEWNSAASFVVSNLILAYGVMEALDISEVHYVGAQGGNAIGLLLSPQYWDTQEQAQ